MLDFLVNLWHHTCMENQMTSKQDIASFWNDADAQIADNYAMKLEELANLHEVTVDYIIEEFILN